MLQSTLFAKTLRENPKDEISKNAVLLERASFIAKTMAGVYTLLPLGWRVLAKIENIAREEMNRIGAQELFMPTLHPRENWEKTGRWESFDALFKVKSRYGNEYALGPTHEEIIYPLLIRFIESNRDLPQALYQIQTKFRDEPRVKSGLLRGREFRMKDLYSFHTDEADRNAYYNKVKEAYHRIFKRLALKTIETEALGGTFSSRSLEFQVISPAGEDTIYFCSRCGIAANKELVDTEKRDAYRCARCNGSTEMQKAIEVCNLFPLKEKFAQDFGITFQDGKGEKHLVAAGCYGLGTTRLMGTIVEIHSDERGIRWPDEVAPFEAHLIEIKSQKSKVKRVAKVLYEKFAKYGVDVLYDDRDNATAGEKFADADLIGIPLRIVVSEKTIEKEKVEIKRRDGKIIKFARLSEIVKMIMHKKNERKM